MRTVAILPVKSFGRAKQRLTGGFPDRPGLAAAMVADVLDALGLVEGLAEVLVVTAAPVEARPGVVVVHDPAEAGQSAAAGLGIAAAVERGAERVLLVPGDCPALDPDEVAALLAGEASDRASTFTTHGRATRHSRETTGGADVVIVPDRHGTGTNALLLSPPTVMAPAFGEGSFARHAALASAAGVTPRVAEVRSLGLDVDTPEDLAALRRALAAWPRGAVRTRALLGEAAVA
jgi:2-phospho-L-lactate/phosphoenolpyruvate guanylyltransferase